MSCSSVVSINPTDFLISGDFGGEVDLGMGNLISSGEQDIFIARLPEELLR